MGDDDLLDELMALAGASPGRFEVLGTLGRGGMGEVELVLDRRLDRLLARKVIRSDCADPALLRRFLREARITARLQHPGVVPVHDLEETPDGRPCFTMKRVDGRPLDALLAGPERPALPTLVDVILRVAEAADYAHSRGVIHRDIKPANIAVGAFGEVLLLDWGVAWVGGSEEEVTLSAGGEGQTRAGEVIGTPAYMAPEQARGEPVTPAVDVYALGMVLGEVLTGRALRGKQALYEARRGDPVLVPPISSPGQPVSDELREIVLRATASEVSQRTPDAASFAAQLRAWRDGDLRRARALAEVDAARSRLPEVATRRARAAALSQAADAQLQGLHAWDPAERKAVAWALQDEAQREAVAADVAEVEVVRALDAAVQAAPELDEARALLADLYRAAADEAQARGDRREALRCEALVRVHDRGAHRAWLHGEGSISLVTDPPAAVVLWQLTGTRRRERVHMGERMSPLVQLPVAPGAWWLELQAPGRPAVGLHVWVGRGEAWTMAPPEGHDPVIRLPRQLDPGEVFVPAGWFTAGGDPEASEGLPRTRFWVDAFILRRHPVTNTEYIAFLDDLVASGREGDALRHRPADSGKPCYLRDERGRFLPGADQTGTRWLADAPVVFTTWHDAAAYASWLAARTGQPWRLPHDLEREKAARGVDGRLFPWGDQAEPTWASMADSEAGPPRLRPVGATPTDRSPYGAEGLAGNVREWCGNAYERVPRGPVVKITEPEGDVWRMVRGGSWSAAVALCRAAGRYASRPDRSAASLGLRVARSVTDRDL